MTTAAADALDAPATTGRRDSASALLGTLALLGAPCLLFASLAAGGRDWGVSLTNTLLQIAYLGGWACGMVGMRRLGVTGRGKGADALLAVQLVGLAFAIAASVWENAVGGREPAGGALRTAYFAVDTFWPASHVLMLVVAGFVFRTKVWTGWRAAAPLACGLALPSFFAVAALFGRESPAASVFPALVTAGFAAIGAALLLEGLRKREA